MRLSYLQAAKLAIGAYDGSVFTFAGYTSAGLLTNPGVSIFGASTQIGTVRAGVTISTPAAIPGIGALPFSLEVTGVSNFVGNTNQLGLYTCNGASIFNGTQTTNGVNTVNAASILNGSTTINGALVVNGATHINGFLSFISSIVGTTKEFDIPHPSKENYRLAHGCIEGPEFGVYFRGKSKTNTINLPDYWKDLVHEDTITVNLTPIGKNQNLYVEYIKDNQIKVGGGVIVQGETQFNYHYTIFAERKDVNKLVPEYEGTEIIHQGGPK